MAFQDIRKNRKWLSAEEIRFLLILVLVLGGLLALNIALARVLPGGEWFHLRWSAARAFLIEGLEPYSTAVAQRTQMVAYGRLAEADEYAYVLNDPFHILLLYTPLALFPDFAVARGIWMLLSEAALIGTVLLAIYLAEWQPPRWFLVLVLGFGLFSYYSVSALLSGSPVIFLNILYLGILLALRSQADELAGALLFLVAYQWEVGGIFFLIILIAVFLTHRWRVLAGFGMLLLILIVISWLAYSGWGLPYVRAVLSDLMRGANLTFSSIMAFWFPDSPYPIGTVVASVLGLIIFLEWLRAIEAHFRRVVWGASLALAVTPFAGLMIFPSNHVMLLLPFVVILALAWERWRRRRVLVTLLIFLVGLLVPFGLHYQSQMLGERLYGDLLLLLPPAATILALYWVRWWVTRASRPWIDQVGIRP